MADSKGTDFVVHLDAVDIPEKERAAIARAIQAATLNELARLDLGGAMSFRVPRREWLGLWLERLQIGESPVARVMVGRP
jgi:hypothetical protein